jgi:hypothetical protein
VMIVMRWGNLPLPETCWDERIDSWMITVVFYAVPTQKRPVSIFFSPALSVQLAGTQST